MNFHPVFLSVICVCRNQSDRLKTMAQRVSDQVASIVSDYEVIMVDNASTDDSIQILRQLTEVDGLPNIQVYALTKTVDHDTAAWVGIENALGDFVAVIDPLIDDISFLPNMLNQAVSGADVVFARNTLAVRHDLVYRLAFHAFNMLYKWGGGVHLEKDAPRYRLLSKRVVNFILQFSRPAMAYRHLPATAGFAKCNLTYSAQPQIRHDKHLGSSIDRGLSLLTSTTRAPMRLVTSLSLFGAIANIVYSLYVVTVGLVKEDVAEGWLSLSLQQSGMFFLISLVLLVLGEYILNMTSNANEGPQYHIAQEFTSAHISRREKLNIEDTGGARFSGRLSS
jgi:polyisoprenyl-phosphate glycosyltransferase